MYSYVHFERNDLCLGLDLGCILVFIYFFFCPSSFPLLLLFLLLFNFFNFCLFRLLFENITTCILLYQLPRRFFILYVLFIFFITCLSGFSQHQINIYSLLYSLPLSPFLSLSISHWNVGQTLKSSLTMCVNRINCSSFRALWCTKYSLEGFAYFAYTWCYRFGLNVMLLQYCCFIK